MPGLLSTRVFTLATHRFLSRAQAQKCVEHLVERVINPAIMLIFARENIFWRKMGMKNLAAKFAPRGRPGLNREGRNFLKLFV
jgi:hypothetical protein